VWAGERSAYLAKTSMLRRRLTRILRPSEDGGRGLNLRGVFTRIEYWQTGSKFESMLLHYAVAKRSFPEQYLKLTRLRMPAYLRLILSNEFPRTQVTTRMSGGASLYYGPFRTRAAAEQFETQLLELFQIRRCQENLEPSPQHPGCIYGEMNMCLRPCQQVVGIEEYRSEANRVGHFLETNGAAALSTAEAARDRLSEEMNFEGAARQHKRIERMENVLALREELVRDVERLYAIVITKSSLPDAVALWFCCRGWWQPKLDFLLTSDVSLDRRLRDLIASLEPQQERMSDREEHLALLARWAYSSWRDGEMLVFDGLQHAPYRKLVRAISKVHSAAPEQSKISRT
jgi:excinuclease ABC subunit C